MKQLPLLAACVLLSCGAQDADNATADLSDGTLQFVRVIAGGGLCTGSCTYGSEVTNGSFKYSAVSGEVSSFQLDAEEFSKVRNLTEAPAFRRAVHDDATADCHDPPGAESTLEVAWLLGDEHTLTAGGGCPETSPIGLVSDALWDLKLKYTGDSL